MLVVSDPEHLQRALQFARDKGLQSALLDQLWFLHTYGCRDEVTSDTPPVSEEWLATDGVFPPPSWLPYGAATRCRLGKDYVPASFSFVIEKTGGARWFNGGLIYHGDQSGWVMPNGQVIPPGYGVETFSVNLVAPERDRPWSIHT